MIVRCFAPRYINPVELAVQTPRESVLSLPPKRWLQNIDSTAAFWIRITLLVELAQQTCLGYWILHMHRPLPHPHLRQRYTLTRMGKSTIRIIVFSQLYDARADVKDDARIRLFHLNDPAGNSTWTMTSMHSRTKTKSLPSKATNSSRVGFHHLLSIPHSQLLLCRVHMIRTRARH